MSVTPEEAIDLCGYTPFDPAQHEMLDAHGNGMFLGYLQRRTRRKDLFLYRHRKWGTFVLAEWVVKPGHGCPHGVMQEIEVMQGHPDHYDDPHPPPDVQFLLARFSTPAPEAARQTLAARKEADYQEASRVAEESEYREDLARHKYRAGDEYEAEMTRAGALDYSSPFTTKDDEAPFQDLVRSKNRCTVRVP